MDLASLHRAHVETLSQGTAAALEKTGFGALLIHSGTPLKRTLADDQYWPLRVTPHFQHWLPLAEPGCALLIVPGRKPHLWRGLEQSFWEAPAPPESDHFWNSFEISSGRAQMPAGRVASCMVKRRIWRRRWRRERSRACTTRRAPCSAWARRRRWGAAFGR